MLQFISWYIAILVIGWVTFPITFRFASRLCDRGYALTKALGMILWAFVFWLLVSFRVLPNDLSGIIAALLIVAIISVILMRKGGWKDAWGWSRDNRRIIITVEIIFIVLFAAWAAIRAANPDINGTEKPMELAFINAISRSPGFPPSDPWLSGYSISYYYFGYVMISMLIRVTGVSSGIGYNLAAAMWFALTAIGAYGIIFNLIRMFRRKHDTEIERNSGLLGGLLGPFFVLIVSNLEGFLEILHSNGIFWKFNADGTATSRFWSWLGILDLNTQPSLPLSLTPIRYMWWWRASRVITQYDLAGNWKEIIDEFPFFSYLLADLHPHVLAMPFVMLAISITLNLYVKWKDQGIKDFSLLAWIRKWEFWIVALVFGGLAFLNTWNFLIYIGLLSAVFLLCRYQIMGSFWKGVWDFIRFAMVLALAGLILYAPFFIGLQSQAQGPTPSVNYFSSGAQFWVMFAPLLIPILYYCAWSLVKNRKKVHWGFGLVFSSLVVFGLWLVSYLFAASMAFLSASENTNLAQMGINFLNLHGDVTPYTLIVQSLINRLSAPGTWITLFVIIYLVWVLLGAASKKEKLEKLEIPDKKPIVSGKHDDGVGFLLILVLLGAGLTILPEFIYLKDVFGWPINTYFKFYFEAWIVWGLAAAYCSYILWRKARKAANIIFSIVWTLVIGMSLVYPILSVMNKTNYKSTAFIWLMGGGIALMITYLIFGKNKQRIHFALRVVWGLVLISSVGILTVITIKHPQYFINKKITLDGLQYRLTYSPDEEAAIHWLSKAPYSTIAEAIGGQYSDFARVSTETGYPTVLGWPGHEDQWRGGRDEIGDRESDIQTLYQTSSWEEAQRILDLYGIRYIYIGSLEWGKYSTEYAMLHEEKFTLNLPVVFQNDSVTIYEYQK